MKTFNKLKKQAGLTLVEVLVAMTLGLIVLGAAIGMQISHQQGFKLTETKLAMQTNAKFAFEFIALSLREVGSIGCRNAENYLGGEDADTTLEVNFVNAFRDPDVPFANFQIGQEILGYDNLEGSTTWLPAVSPDFSFTGDMIDGSDAITIRGAIGSIYRVDRTGNDADILNSIQLNLTGITNVALQPEQYGVLSLCDKAEVFNMTGTEAEFQSGLISHAQGMNGDENESDAFGISIKENQVGELRRMAVTTFYVRNNDNGVPTLYRDIDNVSDPLVEGVERMQIEYGVDTDGTTRNVPDVYLDAQGVESLGTVDDPFKGWKNVISVRVSFIMRSRDNVFKEDVVGNYRLPGILPEVAPYKYEPDDRYARLVYSSTINLRNRSIGLRVE